MARSRICEYLDVYLSASELKKLKKGYSVSKVCKGQHICIKTAKDRVTIRQINKLRTRIKELEGGYK